MLRLSTLMFLLRLDLVGPKEQPRRGRVDRDRYSEKGNLGYGCLGWSITCEQEKHPRKENRGVAVRELPPTWIPVAPKHEC